ncbi:hypothetical protein GQ42DRAFT_164488 [Ramicandelaber brevisporus]|nr:hypothetical protein GQ42DRAFT_164488 [Ramicandelaber brevisporus]
MDDKSRKSLGAGGGSRTAGLIAKFEALSSQGNLSALPGSVSRISSTSAAAEQGATRSPLSKARVVSTATVPAPATKAAEPEANPEQAKDTEQDTATAVAADQAPVTESAIEQASTSTDVTAITTEPKEVVEEQTIPIEATTTTKEADKCFRDTPATAAADAVQLESANAVDDSDVLHQSAGQAGSSAVPDSSSSVPNVAAEVHAQDAAAEQEEKTPVEQPVNEDAASEENNEPVSEEEPTADGGSKQQGNGGGKKKKKKGKGKK